MKIFCIEKDVINFPKHIKINGKWPFFHDSEIIEVIFNRGDMRPDDNVWIGAFIIVKMLTTSAKKQYLLDFRFDECYSLVMKDFNHHNMIYDLTFEYEHRGYYQGDKIPLPPYIKVNFLQSFGISLNFKCFRVEVINCKTE